MDNCHLTVVFLTVALIPLKGDSSHYIKLEGFKTTRNGAPLYQLICNSDKEFIGCTVEFLLNRTTQETIRYANNTCHKADGECNQFQCACFNGCKKLAWFLSEDKNIENQLFECDARIKDNEVFYHIIASGSFKGGDFVNGENIIKKIGGDHPPSQKATVITETIGRTFRKEENISKNDHWLLIANTALTGLIFIIICMMCIGHLIWRKMRKKGKY